MENQKKKVKRLKGFTLGEMVTTVTIIGSLTAIAVPNYLRIRMEVNMEMVRQELRTIQKHMNDLLNRDHRFPQDINTLGNTPEEQSITGSLTAIDLKDYTTDGYRVDPNLSNYQLTTCPTKIGISGDKCFTVNTFSISSAAAGLAAPWDGSSVPMKLTGVPYRDVCTKSAPGPMGACLQQYNYEYAVNDALMSQNLPLQQKIDLLTNYLIMNAWTSLVNATTFESAGGMRSQVFVVSQNYEESFNQIMPAVYDNLKNKGINVYVAERESDRYFSKLPSTTCTASSCPQTFLNRYTTILNTFQNPKALEISFELQEGKSFAPNAWTDALWNVESGIIMNHTNDPLSGFRNCTTSSCPL